MPTRSPIFENRYDAGIQLAAKLAEYKTQQVIVLAIPNGGVPVAVSVALLTSVIFPSVLMVTRGSRLASMRLRA